MSWLSSLFSNFKFPPPADSIRPHEKRVLEEPSARTSTPKQTAPPTHLPSQHAVQSPVYQTDSPHSHRNKLIFATGTAFFALSVLTTRRALARRRLASTPKFYSDQPSHHEAQSQTVAAPFEAVEALNIATINVLSLAMMLTGGSLWYLDINSLTDARRFIRGGLGVEEVVEEDGKLVRRGRTDEEAEVEIEEWVAGVFGKAKEEQDELDKKQRRR